MNDEKHQFPKSPSTATSHDYQTHTEHEPNGRHSASADASQDVRTRLEHGYRELEHQVDQTKQNIQQFNEQAVRFIQENPGWCLIGAVATGYVLGRMASRRWLA